MSENDPVLVAVDGSEASKAALRYAAAEANRLGSDLQVLHATPDFLALGGLYMTPSPFTPADVRAAGEAVLATVVEQAKELVSPDRVTARVVAGDRVPVILDAAAKARIVVLGSHRASLLHRLAVGSTGAGVASYAPVPVVVVPSDWTPPSDVRPIVVAVKRYDDAPIAMIEAALRRAESQHATVRLVHVWDFPEAYGDAIAAMMDFEAWVAGVEARLRTDAAAAFARHPDVHVEVISRYGQPAKVLQELSADAGLLVIGRRPHAFPVGHLGSTGRALLREGRCPVEVLPATKVSTQPVDSAVPAQA